MKSNRLIHATSPYLLQHAHNPVDWYEWGSEALQKAVEEDKPILVSIGYSSCHWCHVMEKQSFENTDIAALMNEYFVCIKVDREERPDIDQVYMEAVQALGVNGGWPLNVFLSPRQMPFFGGTYFAPQAWSQVLINIHQAYTQHRGKIDATADELGKIVASSEIARFHRRNTVEDLRVEIEQSFANAIKSFDTVWGGFERAPKFIMPAVWQWMIRYWQLTRNESSRAQLTLTLNRILQGGIYDQVGGGFARYSVDKEWFAPHFEKMLYDNAQLLSLYAEGYSVTKLDEYRMAVSETVEWMERELMHPEGAFFSALDADSEGEEGNFYIWHDAELRECLREDYDAAARHFQTTPAGNWEHGKNILTRSFDHALTNREQIRQRLLDRRSRRTRPGLDDKIIASWNGMAVVGLADAFRHTGDETFRSAAIRTMQFINQHLIESNTVYRSYKGKRSTTEGFLDDYAYIIAANIQLHQVTLDEKYLHDARRLMSITLQTFYDSTDGYFFYAPTTELIARKKEVFDNVIPSSNSVMARNLLQLASLFDVNEWHRLACSMVDGLRHVIRTEIQYTANWGMAAMGAQHGFYEVVVSGGQATENHLRLLKDAPPFTLFLKSDATSTLPLAVGKETGDFIYVCFNKTCKLPVKTVEEAITQLS